MQFAKDEIDTSAASGARAIRQSPSRHWGRIFAGFAALAALACVAEPGQQTAPGMLIKQDIPQQEANRPPDANQQMEMREKQAKEQNFATANAERRKQIAEDSAKLLKLATDLKTEVDKTTKDTLSLSVIRKAGEIEKLAHNVKEKMKLTVGGS
jgi:ferric-dicitrate binding protein FerR (iron transport regulator)